MIKNYKTNEIKLDREYIKFKINKYFDCFILNYYEIDNFLNESSYCNTWTPRIGGKTKKEKIYIYNMFLSNKRYFNKLYRYFSSSSYYDILGISNNADITHIKQAFYSKVKLYHPDKINNDNDHIVNDYKEKFIEIQAAYEILSNTEKRKAYDISLKDQQYKNIINNRTIQRKNGLINNLINKSINILNIIKIL